MRKLVDKTIRPLSTVANLTPGVSVSGRGYTQLGTLPIGYYRGAPAFWDLDKAVVQPLIAVEEKSILGILDGRLATHDLLTNTLVVGEAVGTVHNARVTVPANQVWYVNAVVMVNPASGGANVIATNWRCSLFADTNATPDADGQAFYAADTLIAGTLTAEFGPNVMVLAIANKPVVLRLTPGATITLRTTNTVAVAAAAVAATLSLFGYIGKYQGT